MILLLDNKDSFVWNLAQALAGLGQHVDVVRSDQLQVERIGQWRALVVSPGPGAPAAAGISVAAIAKWSGRMPILGVCLGHQAIGAAFGARIARGTPVHGRTTALQHDGTGLFAGLASPLQVCRYHSLYVRDLPACLRSTATLPDGECMALRHQHHPTFGVQFHPESFRTEHGSQLLANFLQEVTPCVPR